MSTETDAKASTGMQEVLDIFAEMKNEQLQSESLKQTIGNNCCPLIDSRQEEEFSSVDEITDYAKKTNKLFKALYNGNVNQNKYPTPKDAEKALIVSVLHQLT